ncbi:MAG: tetratricopeptide repeat protein [Betaproteobacteria bacterium]|nr:tetratricopeptide repeat protein [Betaproteobacteria bacterium]
MALLPVVTPLLSSALASRGEDRESARLIAELERKQDWVGLKQLAQLRLARAPEDPDWPMVLGYAQVQLGEHESAAQTFARMVERTPEDIDGWNLLGDAQRLVGRHAAAVRTLDHATTIDPANAITRYLLGEALRADGRLERAKQAYREALRLEPNFAPAWFGLGVALLQTDARAELQPVRERLNALDAGLAKRLAQLEAGNK